MLVSNKNPTLTSCKTSLQIVTSLPLNPQEQQHRDQQEQQKGEIKSDNNNSILYRNQTNVMTKCPVYFLTKGNNSQLIDHVLTNLGWKRTSERYADYNLRWTESSAQINYKEFREGEQLVNHIPNGGLLTNKLGLLMSLREFERRHLNQRGRLPSITMNEFLPKTFILDDPKEREDFFEYFNENSKVDLSQMWICKPIGMNQGKGIFLVREVASLKVSLEKRDEQAGLQPSGLPPRIIQKKRVSVSGNFNKIKRRLVFSTGNGIPIRYIKDPLLLDGCKFDIRCYMLIANTMPYLVFYHPGYIRRSCNLYSPDDTDLITHLTNQYVQKKNPDYSEIKNNTVWSLNQLNDYINVYYQQSKNLPPNWAKTILQWKIQRIIYHVFLSVKNRLAVRLGFFQLFGLDLMLDCNMKVWLLEINSNPALQNECEVLKNLIPTIIKDTLHLSIECFEKCRRGKQILPLEGLEGHSSMFSKSHRVPRLSLDDAPIPNRVSGNIGLPAGWTLIYNETVQSFHSRWSAVQMANLRCWIPPRYKPTNCDKNGVKINSMNLSQSINNNNNNCCDHTKPNCLPLQPIEHNCVHRESIQSTESNSSTQNIDKQVTKPFQQNQTLMPHKLSLPEFRTFEHSLRKYPTCVNSTYKCKSINETNSSHNTKAKNETSPVNILQNSTTIDCLFKTKLLTTTNDIKTADNGIKCTLHKFDFQLEDKNNKKQCNLTSVPSNTDNHALSFAVAKQKLNCKPHGSLQREQVHMATIRLITSSKSESDCNFDSPSMKRKYSWFVNGAPKRNSGIKCKQVQHLPTSIGKYYRKRSNQDDKEHEFGENDIFDCKC